jgi:hypothetical protein
MMHKIKVVLFFSPVDYFTTVHLLFIEQAAEVVKTKTLAVPVPVITTNLTVRSIRTLSYP